MPPGAALNTIVPRPRKVEANTVVASISTDAGDEEAAAAAAQLGNVGRVEADTVQVAHDDDVTRPDVPPAAFVEQSVETTDAVERVRVRGGPSW